MPRNCSSLELTLCIGTRSDLLSRFAVIFTGQMLRSHVELRVFPTSSIQSLFKNWCSCLTSKLSMDLVRTRIQYVRRISMPVPSVHLGGPVETVSNSGSIDIDDRCYAKLTSSLSTTNNPRDSNLKQFPAALEHLVPVIWIGESQQQLQNCHSPLVLRTT